MTFDEALALRKKIEATDGYHVTRLEEHPYGWIDGDGTRENPPWWLFVHYQYQENNQHKYSVHRFQIRSCEDWERMQERMQEQTARDKARYPSRKKAP